jgi:hypothetical protein
MIRDAISIRVRRLLQWTSERETLRQRSVLLTVLRPFSSSFSPALAFLFSSRDAMRNATGRPRRHGMPGKAFRDLPAVIGAILGDSLLLFEITPRENNKKQKRSRDQRDHPYANPN